MHTNSKTGVSIGLLLLALSGTADAMERQQSRSPHNQSRGMIERLHQRDDHNRDLNHRREHGRNEWRHEGRRDHHGRQHHRDRDRHLYYGHERWREGLNGHRNLNDRGNSSNHHYRHSRHGRGYWHAFHNGHDRRHHHGYRHRFHNNYHYYYNTTGFYFPGYGFITHGHTHGGHCPQWHFEDFATGFVLGAIIVD